ncbi:MAG: peptidase domain-containing ABC transporter [Rhodanobacteraceae bacterium]|nr:peptidase domain-containing ABC transporter [Rhodanobacteraceae bacterium]
MNLELGDALERSSLLRFVPPEHVAAVRALFDQVDYEFGDVIVAEGEAADAFFVLVDGRARAVKAKADGGEIMLGRLLPGDEFGEAALFDGGVRTATVRASTRASALRLGRSAFQELLQRYPELRQSLELMSRWRILQSFLFQSSDFGRLPAPALRALMAALEPATVSRGELIVREGDAAGPMMILRAGRARAWRGSPADPEHLAVYRPGDYFGERSLLTGEPRAANVEALLDCELLLLPIEAAQQLRERYPEFDLRLSERLAEYEHRVQARIPLDFAEELLPAEAQTANPLAGMESADEDEIFAEDGLFRRRRSRFRPFPFVAQIDEMDCGAACLAMICRHFGRDISLSRLRALAHTAHDGSSLMGLCAAAAELGLAARSLKVSARHLDQLPLPAICHWQGHHWVVLYELDGRHAWIADPGLGKRRIPRDQFLAAWSGYSALFDYTDAFLANEQPPRVGLSWLWALLVPHRHSLLLAAGLAGLVSVLSLLFPVLTQFVVDQVIVDQDVDLLTLVLGAMGAALGFLLLAQLIQQYLLAFVAVRVDSAALDVLTRRLLSLPMSYFHTRRTGDIQRRLDGARQVRQFLVQQGIGGALALLQLSAALLLMAMYSLPLAAVFALTVPFYVGLMWVSRRVLRPLYADIEEAHGRYASHQIDAIRGIEAVKAGGAELVFRDAMLAQFLKVSRQQFRGNFMVMAYDSALQAIGFATLLAFLWVGARQVIAGELSVGALVAFNSLLAMAAAAILKALGAWDELQFVSVLLNRLGDIFEQEPEQGRDRSHLRPVPSLQGEIAVEAVSFRYGGPQAPEILKDIQLQLAPGRTYALVGRSGCGKTTLVKLIAGLIEPTAGAIFFDRVDSRQLNHRDLRRHIGFVLQENHLFDATVLANIAFGDPEPDLDRAMRAAQQAYAHDFVTRLALGYETRIGDSGLALSGGQRQRIAIARALYHDPPILIFDEATSALDSESERAIQGNLAQIARGRTCLVIAHRLSTIREADEIIVLEQGQIAERGTHDALLQARGLYFFLHSQQLGL